MDTTDIGTVLGIELLTLRHVARIVARADDAESRIQDILRHLAASHGLMRGRVLIADPAAGEIYIRYAHGLTAAELERGRYRVGEGVSGQVFKTGIAALVADVHDEPGYLGRVVPLESHPPEAIAFLVVPIVRDQLPIGVLAALRRPSAGRPAQCDLAVMEVVAMLIAQILCAAGEAQPWSCPALCGSREVAPPAVPASRNARHHRHSRDLTLRIAGQRHGEGRLHMATDLYLKVLGQHRGTDEAQVAESRLLEIVAYHEAQGSARLAADVLSRLEQVLDGGDAEGDGAGGGGNSDWPGDSGGAGGNRARLP